MTMITPSYLGETIEYSSLHACRSTLEDPTATIFFMARISPTCCNRRPSAHRAPPCSATTSRIPSATA